LTGSLVAAPDQTRASVVKRHPTHGTTLATAAEHEELQDASSERTFWLQFVNTVNYLRIAYPLVRNDRFRSAARVRYIPTHADDLRSQMGAFPPASGTLWRRLRRSSLPTILPSVSCRLQPAGLPTPRPRHACRLQGALRVQASDFSSLSSSGLPHRPPRSRLRASVFLNRAPVPWHEPVRPSHTDAATDPPFTLIRPTSSITTDWSSPRVPPWWLLRATTRAGLPAR